ncbi:MAG: hypothetical protein ACLPTJ_09560 [Solirubrobacteraceae bacterium]
MNALVVYESMYGNTRAIAEPYPGRDLSLRWSATSSTSAVAARELGRKSGLFRSPQTAYP